MPVITCRWMYMKSAPDNDNDGLRTVARALRVLEFVAEEPRQPSVKDVAESLGLNISTCHHIAKTLLERGYLTKGAERRLALGPQVAALHSAFLRQLRPVTNFVPILEELVERTGETSYAAMWDDGEVSLQAVVEGRQALRVTGLRVGYRGMAHSRASGKAVLAYLPDGELSAYLADHPLTATTPNTITDEGILRDALAEIRSNGYAVDNQEFASGVWCIAAPFFGSQGAVQGAVSISMPASRWTSTDGYSQHVLRAASLISERLGHPAVRAPAATLPEDTVGHAR
jgi:IclR family transcriptional regulator, acetate operon repressor